MSASVLESLRSATRSRHDALDAAVDVSTRERYEKFLVASLAAVAGLEPLVADAVGGDPDERARALRADLDELGVETPAPLPVMIAGRDEVLGAAYVLEGSSLGGLVLAQRVESFTTASRFLRGRGSKTAARWKDVLALLERDVADVKACRDGACAAFDHYERAFRTHGVLA